MPNFPTSSNCPSESWRNFLLLYARPLPRPYLWGLSLPFSSDGGLTRWWATLAGPTIKRPSGESPDHRQHLRLLANYTSFTQKLEKPKPRYQKKAETVLQWHDFREFQASVTSKFKEKWCNIYSSVQVAKDGETTHVTFCRMRGNLPWPKFHFHSNCPLFPLRSVFRTSNLNWLSFTGFAPFLKQSFGKVVFWQTKTINCGFYYDLSHIVGLKNHSYLSGNNLVYPHTAVGFSTPSAPRISFCLPYGVCVGEGIL